MILQKLIHKGLYNFIIMQLFVTDQLVKVEKDCKRIPLSTTKADRGMGNLDLQTKTYARRGNLHELPTDHQLHNCNAVHYIPELVHGVAVDDL